jgi:hypothetical protein
MKLVLPSVLLFVCACGAKVGGSDDAGGGTHEDAHEEDAATPRDTGAGKDVGQTTPHDAGVDCGQPKAPVYSCSPGKADGGFCYPYGEDAGTTYPNGCTVTLPMCDTAFGGAQTCNCGFYPGAAGLAWACGI